MDMETTQTTTTTKLPLLKQNEYELWRLRIEQYFLIQDYALWEIIENGNSFKPKVTETTENGVKTQTIIGTPVTAEEMLRRKNDLNAKSMLLMAIPNDQLLTFSNYKDAKNLFQAITERIGGNEATKKT